MEDVITAAPPPSRFFLEDLDNFTPPSPPLIPPFLVFSTPNQDKPISPSLLIIAISSPSLHFFDQISSKTLIGTLVLPDIPFSGNSIEPSLKDKSANLYALNNDNSTIVVSLQLPIAAERSHAVAQVLINEQITPERVLILDSIQSRNFRGKLSPDETFSYKLETSSQRSASSSGDTLLKGLNYLPSGSVVDGVGAALLFQCQKKKIKGTLCVAWPDFGSSVTFLVYSLLKGVLPGGLEAEFMRSCQIMDHHADSELYT